MAVRSLGYGPAAKAGGTGPQGPAGPTGPQGAKGDTGATGAKGDTGVAGATGPKGDTGAQGLQGIQGVKGDTGVAGSSATATPLGTATPLANGTAAPGSSANAAREDHVHPRQVVLVGNITVSETPLVSLAAGNKRMNVALAGVTTADMGKLIAVPNGTPTTGCEMLNVYPAATAGNVSVGYSVPVLGIGATYSIPISVYRIV